MVHGSLDTNTQTRSAYWPLPGATEEHPSATSSLGIAIGMMSMAIIGAKSTVVEAVKGAALSPLTVATFITDPDSMSSDVTT